MNEVAEELPVHGTAPDLSAIDRLKAIAAGLSTNSHTLRDQVRDLVHEICEQMAAVLAVAHDVSAVRVPAVEGLAERIEQLEIEAGQHHDTMENILQMLRQLQTVATEEETPPQS